MIHHHPQNQLVLRRDEKDQQSKKDQQPHQLVEKEESREFKTEIESVWWSVKEKEKERKVGSEREKRKK